MKISTIISPVALYLECFWTRVRLEI